jgi:predicted CXXCH cytochrome family protein
VVVVLCAVPAWAGDVSSSGVCARCHEVETALAADAGGHAQFIDCNSCHDDLRPGRFGPGHRSIPTSCTSHHTVDVATHPMPAKPLKPGKLRRSCLKCHDPHGSTNAHLINTAIRTHGRLAPIDFHDAGGAVAGGFVDPAMPGHGLCEVCHRKTKFYTAKGDGMPHFTDDCTLCHDHTQSFAPVVTAANCFVCHADEASLLDKPSRHHDIFSGNCVACHAEVSPDPGPGHRAIRACADCHGDIAPHAPPGVPAFACTDCHEPHGTNNIELVRDVIHTPQAGDKPVHFDNRDGQADGSFASVSAPGTGVCEICHTTTQFFRADGTGATHYALPCFPCHTHAAGFAPQ